MKTIKLIFGVVVFAIAIALNVLILTSELISLALILGVCLLNFGFVALLIAIFLSIVGRDSTISNTNTFNLIAALEEIQSNLRKTSMHLKGTCDAFCTTKRNSLKSTDEMKSFLLREDFNSVETYLNN